VLRQAFGPKRLGVAKPRTHEAPARAPKHATSTSTVALRH
jgi:hypothetical protein